jgi:two-component system, cell cycle sensor histidine kinase and response regulator CckA
MPRHEHPAGLKDCIVHSIAEDLAIRAAQTSPQKNAGIGVPVSSVRPFDRPDPDPPGGRWLGLIATVQRCNSRTIGVYPERGTVITLLLSVSPLERLIESAALARLGNNCLYPMLFQSCHQGRNQENGVTETQQRPSISKFPLVGPDTSETAALIAIVRRLSIARSWHEVIEIVTHAARTLLHADGITFVLREGENCYYAEEDAVSPLWKGRRFPLDACISGWCMVERKSAVVPDIYQDDRIPQDAYKPTFVRSLAMVPVRQDDPIAAMGAYWARTREIPELEVELFQSIANAASLAMAYVEWQIPHTEKLKTFTLTAQEREEPQQKWAQMEHMTRLATLGELTATLTHEIKQPLSAILLNTSVGIKLLDAPQPNLQKIRDTFFDIERITEHAGEVIRGTRDMLRRDTPGVTDVDLNELIRSVERIVRRDATQHNVQVQLDLSPGISPVKGDTVQLQQVMLNLMLNAFSAMSGAELNCARQLIIRTKSIEGSHVQVEVQDSGTGISPDKLEGIFEAFMTSKPQGLGMGLSICRTIIERHGGKIWAANNPDRGATFSIVLPVTRE